MLHYICIYIHLSFYNIPYTPYVNYSFLPPYLITPPVPAKHDHVSLGAEEEGVRREEQKWKIVIIYIKEGGGGGGIRARRCERVRGREG